MKTEGKKISKPNAKSKNTKESAKKENNKTLNTLTFQEITENTSFQ